MAEELSLKERIQKGKWVLVYFSFPECNVCKSLKPKIQAVLENYPQIEFLYVDTHQHPALAGQYLVFAAPTIILFSEGREIRRFGRFISIEEFKHFIERMMLQENG